jgi:hypothetical protein
MRPLIFPVLLSITGCLTPPQFVESAHWDTGFASDAPVAEQGLVDFLNAWAISTIDVLDHECGLRSDSAVEIDLFRAGPSGTYGDGDDARFGSEADVLAVPMVGVASLERLYVCAYDSGFIE